MTAASSRVEASTRIRGSVATGTWRKTWANSAGPSLQAQRAPCEKRVNRIAVMGAVVIGSPEDTRVERGAASAGSPESPRQNRAGNRVSGQVQTNADERGASRKLGAPDQPVRDCHQDSDEQEQERPAPASERVEPERGEQGEDRGFDEPPLEYRRDGRGRAPRVSAPLSGGRRDRHHQPRNRGRRNHEPGGDGHPRQQ